MHCIWFGTAKDRKMIIKTMKEFLEKVTTAENGHMLLLAAMDSGLFQLIDFQQITWGLFNFRNENELKRKGSKNFG